VRSSKTVQATPTNVAVWSLRSWAGLWYGYGVPDLIRWHTRALGILVHSYKSNAEFYQHLDALTASLTESGFSEAGQKIAFLIHKVAWTTSSELFGELRNRRWRLQFRYRGSRRETGVTSQHSETGVTSQHSTIGILV